MELLERSGCLEILSGRFREVAAGAGHAIFIYGEAGVGKTSLVNSFVKTLGDSAHAYIGACDSLFTPRPLGPLYDIATQIGSEFLDLLKHEKDRPVIFASFLQALSASALPVVLVFEDVHWADEATVDFIKFLARRIGRFKCLFLLTYRDSEIHFPHPLRSVFGELSSDCFSKLSVVPFSAEAVNTLALKKGYSSGDALFALTDGNPFYVTEILANNSLAIPERVKDSILMVFHSKDQSTQALWELLSILPSGIEMNLTAKIEREFPGGIEDCIRLGVIVDKQEFLCFKHELYRLTIEGSLSVYRRKALHRKMLTILLNDPDAINNKSRTLHHAMLADERQVIADIAPQAAREASLMGAHIEASKLYLAAIEFADKADVTLVELYERHAYECYLTNQISAAIGSQTQALELWREQKVRLKEGDATRFLSRLWWYAGDRAKAVRYAQEAIAILENGFPTRERALAYSNLSQLYMLADDREQTLVWGNRAIELAVRMNDKEILSHALNNVGSVMLRISEFHLEGEEKLHQSLSLALENSLQEHAARAYTNLAYGYILGKSYTKAITVLEDGLKYCEANDLNTWAYYMLGEKVKFLVATGKWQQAESIATLLLSNSFHPAIVRIVAMAELVRLKSRQGYFDDARSMLAEGKILAAITGEAQRIIPMLTAELELCWISRQPISLIEVTTVESTLFVQKDNSWNYTDLAYWMHKCGLPLTAGIRYDGPFRIEHAGNWKAAAQAWKNAGCEYEQALALFNGDEAHQKEALVMLDKLGASAASMMLKAELKRKGVRNIPRGPHRSTLSNAAQLTTRQIDVLNLLRDGLQNKEIADKLFISPKTVDHHISAILSQLAVTSRGKAVLEALRIGILK